MDFITEERLSAPFLFRDKLSCEKPVSTVFIRDRWSKELATLASVSLKFKMFAPKRGQGTKFLQKNITEIWQHFFPIKVYIFHVN